MDHWEALARLARRQHGVVTVRQAADLGFSDRTLRRQAGGRGWERLHPGVYALPGSAPTHERRVMAALLAAGERSLAARRTALWVLGVVDRAPTAIELVVPWDRRRPTLAGVSAFGSSTLLRSDVTVVRGLRVTSVARTVCDLAAVADVGDLRAAIIDARQRRLVTVPQVAARLERMGPVTGAGQLRRLLWELEEERCDSVLEHRVRELLRRHHVTPSPHPQPYPVLARGRVVEIDIAGPQLLVGMEVDGFGSHSARAQLARDHRRGNRLTLSGWRILRVGWDRYDRDPQGIVVETRALLAQAQAAQGR